MLGELPQAERDSFEAHYFDCGECALDVRAAAALADNARNVLCHEAPEVALQVARPTEGKWLAWFKPIVAVPASAVLLLVIAYQNTVTIPNARRGHAKEPAVEKSAAGPNPSNEAMRQAGFSQKAPNQSPSEMNPVLVGSVFSLHSVNVRRGEDVDTSEVDSIQVQPAENFAFRLDFTPNQVFDRYVGKLVDSSGREVFRIMVPGNSTNKKMQLAIPGGLLKPGTYSLIFARDLGANGLGNGSEVLRYRFTITFK